MRVVTFNILHGRSLHDQQVDVEVLRRAVKDLDPDVLALQEVDRNQTRSHGHDLTAVAAEAMGAPEHRFVAALTGSPGATWEAATGEEQPDAAAYGIALLSRYPVPAWQVVRLAPIPTPIPMRFQGQLRPSLVRDEPRVAVAALVESPFGPMTVATTHLSFVRWWNGRQLRHLTAALDPLPRPLVLTGDLNMLPDRARHLTGYRSLAVGHPTFPADAPREQIDHILCDAGDDGLPFRGEVRAFTRRMPLSDHVALVVDLPEGREPQR